MTTYKDKKDFNKQILEGRKSLERKRNRLKKYQKKEEFADTVFVAAIVFVIILTLLK